MSKHVRSALFYVLAPLWGHMCEEGEERREGGTEPPFTACPVEMAAGDSIDRNSFVLELEKRFSESRFFMETRPNYMGGGSGLFTFFSA